MYSLKAISTDCSLVINNKIFKHGEILTQLLNTDFTEITNLYVFLSSSFLDKNKNAEKLISAFKLIDLFLVELPFYKDFLKPEYLSTFDKELTFEKHTAYLKVVSDLKEIDGFYTKFLTDYCHNENHYPKAVDIAKSFKKYKLDFDLTENEELRTPNMIKFYATPVITNDGFVCHEYFIEDISSLVYLDFMQCITNEVIPKKCKNCNKFYLPSFGYYSDFCGEIAPNNETKTCREIGSKQSFDKKLEQNPILKEYQKAYKTHHARFVKKKMTKDELDAWKVFAKDMVEQVKAEKILFDEFLSEIKK